MRLNLILRLILALIFATFAVIFSQLIPPIAGANLLLVKVLVTILAAWMGYLVFPDVAKYVRVISLTLFNYVSHQLSAEVSNQLMRLPRPTFGFGHHTPQIGSVALTKPLILDTSAIIDGRILDIAKTGFLNGLILLPRFVLTELQQVADSKDDLKRARGRRGFEMMENLKKLKGLRVEIWDKQHSGQTVDEKLLNLAKSLHGKIVTTDFNLNKVASVVNVAVLNVNDLANALKTTTLPGESLEIKIVHVGKDPKQGVGYLPDGTMVVVANGADLIGQTVKAEVTKNLQIPQGKMIFAKEV